MTTLGGNVCIRNGKELDYCWREAIKSLLPVCDYVTVCDGESTDGTQDELRDMASLDPRIRVCVYPWKHPKGDIDFWVNWLNYCREHIKQDYQIQLDADEILSEKSYPFLHRFKEGNHTEALWCKRYNFWGDAKSLIPHGYCCSHRVARVAPTSVWMPSDGPHPNGATLIAMAVDSPVEIFHYGFLRERKAFFRKSRELQSMFFNSYDPRLEDVEGNPANWMREIKGVEWTEQLLPFTGEHPTLGKQWLKERNHDI